MKLGSLVVGHEQIITLNGQEGLTNGRKSETEPAGLGLCAPWYGTGNGVVVVVVVTRWCGVVVVWVAVVVQAAVVV